MRAITLIVPALLAAAACGDGNTHHLADAPSGGHDGTLAGDGRGGDASGGDASGSTGSDGGGGTDATPVDAAPDHDSTILVALSPGGSNSTANWQGILQFQVTGDGAALVAGAGIGSAQVEDPVALTYRPSTHEVFVGDRHGNIAADGVPGSVSRFLYDQTFHTFTPNGEITGNGLNGVHQVAFSPTTGELFCGNDNGNISRFTFDILGHAVANGQLTQGTVRGVFVAPDGLRLYATDAGSQIHEFDLTTGLEITGVSTGTSGGLHFFTQLGGDLYVAAFNDGLVYRYTIGADDNLTFVETIPADAPIGVAFSADGLEMFVTGHFNTDLLDRFSFDAAHDTWVKTDAIPLGSSLGGIVILPG